MGGNETALPLTPRPYRAAKNTKNLEAQTHSAEVLNQKICRIYWTYQNVDRSSRLQYDEDDR